jgi:hypothetical protein
MVQDELPFETDEPVDPDAHEFDDSDEGTDAEGVPVRSVEGSEKQVWGEDG